MALDDGAFKWLLTGLGKSCSPAESFGKVDLLLSRMISLAFLQMLLPGGPCSIARW